MFRRLASGAALALVLALSCPSHASVVAGKDYTPLQTAQPTQVPAGKIEIIEFFSFACPHCYESHRKVLEWAHKLPADVTFRQVPVAFDKPGWQPLARAAYAMQATGDFDRLESPFFDAIHKERQPLFDEQAITDWMAKHGVDRSKFTTAWNSFSVNTHMANSDRMAVSYEISGVPQFVVDGRYIVQGTTYDQLLANAASLAAQAKAERAGKKH
jgi:protein dithiol oxidoreductase (disulfide-forming)